MTDPRTGREIKNYSDCHLIPEFLGISNLTVRLDRDFDNFIGERCDNALQAFIREVEGVEVKGKFDMRGNLGAPDRSYSAEYNAKKRDITIFQPKGSEWPTWFRSGSKADIRFRPQVLRFQDVFLSMLNSAFLVLHYVNNPMVGEGFDKARAMLAEAEKLPKKGDFDEATRNALGSMIHIDILLPQLPPNSAAMAAHEEAVRTGGDIHTFCAVWDAVRPHYDANFDPCDGVIEDFPNRSHRLDEAGNFIVVLPYSKCIRASVNFGAWHVLQDGWGQFIVGQGINGRLTWKQAD